LSLLSTLYIEILIAEQYAPPHGEIVLFSSLNSRFESMWFEPIHWFEIVTPTARYVGLKMVRIPVRMSVDQNFDLGGSFGSRVMVRP